MNENHFTRKLFFYRKRAFNLIGVRPFDLLLELPVELMDRWDMVLAGRNRYSKVRYRADDDDDDTVRVSQSCPPEVSHEFEKIDAWVAHWQAKARTRPPTFGDTPKSFFITHTFGSNRFSFELRINVSTHCETNPVHLDDVHLDDDGCHILRPELSYSWFFNRQLVGNVLSTSFDYRNMFVDMILRTTDLQMIPNGNTTLTLTPPANFQRASFTGFSNWIVV
jgi:hypothetical protein